jgi:hypothetical protein
MVMIDETPLPPLKDAAAVARQAAAGVPAEGLEWRAALAAMDKRGFAPFLLAAAFLLILPIDFALPQIAGVTIIVCALALLAGAQAPPLPWFVAKMRVKKERLEGVAKFFDDLDWARLVLTPRHAEFATGAGETLAALALLLLGIASAAGLPNTLPALGVCAIGLGLLQRDGLVMLIGVAVAIGWIAFLVAMAVGAHLNAPFASGWMNENAAWALKYLAPAATGAPGPA